MPAQPGSGQPFLAAHAGGVWMSWTEPAKDGHRVAAARYSPSGAAAAAAAPAGAGAPAAPALASARGAWGPTRTIATGEGFFVNWADFPSVRVFGERLYAHWLWRGGDATYDYGVRVAWSDDEGATWSEPWTPHTDGTPTEHGFVSFLATSSGADGAEGPGGATADDGGGAGGAAGAVAPGEVWVAWLDGRAMVEPFGPMSLRARALPAPGGSEPAVGRSRPPGPETLVDDRACECCQTDAVVAGGVPVVVFRDRAEGEVRDIHVSRLETDGGAPAWSPSRAVHRDGWVFGGCPVNGPAMDALGDQVAVAWFTAPDAAPRVSVAFSPDAAATFAEPFRLDGGAPLGRVDAAFLDDGSVVATWMEEVPGADGGAAIMARRVWPDGRIGEPRNLAATGSARAAGFPRIARAGAREMMLAWTDPAGAGTVRAALFDPYAWEGR